MVKGVDGDLRGEVATAVRHGSHGRILPVCRERPVPGPRRRDVTGVDRDGGAAAYPREQVSPREVTGETDLDPVTLRQQRPMPLLPGEFRVGQRIAEVLVTAGRVDEHLADDTVSVELADDTRDDVEPFVGHDEDIGEVAQLVGQRRAARPTQPAHPVGQVGRAFDDIDPEQGAVRPMGVQRPDELTTSGADVNDAGELEQVGVVPDRLGEDGAQRWMGRGGEVSCRHLPAVEPARAVERLLPCVDPADLAHSRKPTRARPHSRGG